MVKENWVPAFRDKDKTIPIWANTNGSDVVDYSDHDTGPSNGAYRAAGGKIVSSPSEAFRRNFELIEWSK